MTSRSPASTPGWLARGAAALALLGWIGLAALALAKLPRGFPLGWRFVAQDLLPWLLALAGAVGLASLRRPAIARALLEALAALALAAAAGCVWRFPESRPLLQGVLGGLGLATSLASAALRRASVPRGARLAALLLGALCGLVVPEALRAPDPSTRPSGRPVTLPEEARVEEVPFAPAGTLRLDRPGWSLEVDPFFVIESRSPDRGWTALAPPGTRHRTDWQLVARAREGNASRSAWRSEDGAGTVAWSAVAQHGGEGFRLDAAFTLDVPVYTHLATWSSIRLVAEEVRVLFSPCGDAEIEVLPSDYPEGRPARFAYLAPGDRFVVAEAQSGEKGPFRVLCEGPLRRGEALTITLAHARGRAILALRDFASQASVEPSPTAGWGVPQNAIQLLREGGSRSGPVLLLASLAATGIGRGWDTVGLAAGTYRNRMHVRIEDRR